MSGYLEGVAAILAINVLLAYAVYLPAAAGVLNLGVAGFMAIGAYVGGYLDAQLGAPVWVTLVAAAVVAGAAGWLISFPILRTRGVYLVLATFAFGEIVAGIIINIDAVGGAAGYPVPTFVDLPALALAALGVTLAVFFLMSTRLGLIVRSIHDDENVTALFGIDARRVKALTFSAGAAVAGLAGVLYAHHYNFIEVAQFDLTLSIDVLLFVLIGGTQTAWGPLAGAAVFTLLPEALRAGTQWRYVIFAVLIILVMAFRPEGIVTRAGLQRLLRADRRPAT
jgi:branched-chain amino acid transport system permease protein